VQEVRDAIESNDPRILTAHYVDRNPDLIAKMLVDCDAVIKLGPKTFFILGGLDKNHIQCKIVLQDMETLLLLRVLR
jgi:peptidase E